jgi:hypothetical protein
MRCHLQMSIKRGFCRQIDHLFSMLVLVCYIMSTHMHKQERKDKQRATVKLSTVERMSLEFDRKVIRDMGLKMPRITPKYWLAVKALSQVDNTSPYFYHLFAARKGQRAIYTQMKQLGYSWKHGKWYRF